MNLPNMNVLPDALYLGIRDADGTCHVWIDDVRFDPLTHLGLTWGEEQAMTWGTLGRESYTLACAILYHASGRNEELTVKLAGAYVREVMKKWSRDFFRVKSTEVLGWIMEQPTPGEVTRILREGGVS